MDNFLDSPHLRSKTNYRWRRSSRKNYPCPKDRQPQVSLSHKPEWGTDAVYKVLDNNTVKQNQGRFTNADLSNIWHDKQVEMNHHIDEPKVWRSGVILKRENTFGEVIEAYNKREIKIRLFGSNKRGFLAVIADEIDKIHSSYHRLQVQKLIPCNCPVCKNTTNIYNSQNLRQAAKEIKDLLDELSQEYDDPDLVAVKAIKKIKNDPTLKSRFMNALKEGGTEALNQLIDHPAVSIVLAASQGFMDA